MANSTVGLRFNVDVGNAPSQVENITKTIASLNKELAKATEEHDYEAIKRVAEALNNATSARGAIMQQANQVQNAQARENMNSGGIFGGQNAWMLQYALTNITHGFIKIFQDAHRAVLQRAGGDYGGAAVTESRSHGEAWGRGIGSAVGLAAYLTPLAPIAPLLSQLLGEIGTWIGGKDAREKEEALTYSAQYKNVLPFIDSLNQLYGGAINNKDLVQNNKHGLMMYGRAAEATVGTGLTTNQLIEAMKEMGGYGIKSETQALNMAQNQALWSRFTNTDLSTIQKYAGQAYRFGGDTGAVSTAYGGLMAQNMGKGQFSEFLNSMERILEEGIAKGFVRSSEEIAGNMAMLYKLSGNSSLWQGEQGAQRLSQMNNAISNATNLQSVEDAISFGVARDMLTDEATSRMLLGGEDGKRGGVYTGTYADVMQLLEQGVSGDLLKGQFEAVSRLEGGNIAGMIERFRHMYGLNYTGAAQVYGMMDNYNMGKEGFSPDEIAKMIEEMKTNPKYQSDSERLQTAINRMTDNLVNIGQFKFNETEWAVLQKQQQDVASILAKLKEDEAHRNAAINAPPVDVPSQAVPTVFTANGGGPAGTLQMFQGGQRFTNYMMTGLTDFQMLYGDMVSYKDRERGTDYGEYIARRMGNALEGLNFDALNPTQDRVLGIGLENLVADFARYKGGGITEREYTDYFERQLRQLTSAIESMKNAVEKLEKDGIQVSGEIHGEIN